MKKIVFPAALIFFIISAVQAQMPRVQKSEMKKTTGETPVKIIKTIPAEPKTPPPPVTNKTASTDNQVTPVYTLTSVRANIRTGSDNKEFPSMVYVELWKKNHQGWDYRNDFLYTTQALKTEMAVNSNSDLGLDKYGGNADKFNLANLQTSGLELSVRYTVNFFMDAWKIENISLTLEFRDQNGNLHPTLGSKIISFSTAVGFLNSEYRIFKCTTDQYFNPLTASIER